MRALPNLKPEPSLEEQLVTLEYTLMGVMHNVDKWLEGDELNHDPVTRAIIMREKLLNILENKTSN